MFLYLEHHPCYLLMCFLVVCEFCMCVSGFGSRYVCVGIGALVCVCLCV